MIPIIEVKGLSKRYRIGEKQSYYSFRDSIVSTTSKLIKMLAPRLVQRSFSEVGSPAVKSGQSGEFWALKDISFKVMPGEVVGIIGRNGAGKSTLLKILSRITPPTKGEIVLRGRSASLLEVGTGFSPELTGRENIYLNGAILGMKRKEVNSKFDEIVEFSGISKFLDTPVKHYSSGMYMRLAFSVAAHLEPEILLVDEVLAVGDIEFQKKCLGKMDEVAKGGRTVLFVSHNMGSIKKLCQKGILLSEGLIKVSGNVNKVVDSYLDYEKKNFKINMSKFYGTLTKNVVYKQILVNNHNNHINISPSSDIVISVKGECKEIISAFRVTISLFTGGERILSMHDTRKPELLPRGRFKSEVTIPGFFLRPGAYSIALGGYKDGMSEWLWGLGLFNFTVLEEWTANYQESDIGIINVPFNGKRTIY